MLFTMVRILIAIIHPSSAGGDEPNGSGSTYFEVIRHPILQVIAAALIAMPFAAIFQPRKDGWIYRKNRSRYLRYITNWTRKQAEKGSIQLPQDYLLELKPEGISETSEYHGSPGNITVYQLSKYEVEWREVVSIGADNDHIFLDLGAKGAFIVPKSAFSGGERDILEFVALAEQYHKEAAQVASSRITTTEGVASLGRCWWRRFLG
jgi:hypothetical protein